MTKDQYRDAVVALARKLRPECDSVDAAYERAKRELPPPAKWTNAGPLWSPGQAHYTFLWPTAR